MGETGKKSILKRIIGITAVFVFLAACSTFHNGFSSGESKNSLPLLEKKMVEEVHSIAVPQFYGDKHNWKNLAQGFLSSEKDISLVSNSKVEQSMKKMNIKLANVKLENRINVLSGLGRSINSDAVINGIILDKGRSFMGVIEGEIIMQLISSKDGRVIWWQAVNFRYRENVILKSAQESLLSKMLEPMLSHIGKRGSKKPIENKSKESELPESKPVDISPM
jgi:hypothetical protein